MRKTKNILVFALIIILALFCCFRADSVKPAVYEALSRCLTIIIPSLYAMMTVSVLLVKTNITSHSQIICGLFSMLAGYPTGAKILCSQYDSGDIEKKEAELLSGVFYGAGGAFIFGCTAYGGMLILLSNILANLIISCGLLLYFRKNSIKKHTRKKILFTSEMLIESVNSAGYSILEICFAVMIFAVITAILTDFGIISALADILAEIFGFSCETMTNIIHAVLDITAVSSMTENNFNLIPIISGLISFGGLCVFLQISAVFKGRLSILPLFAFRIIAGILSGIICRILLPYFINSETVTVSAMSSQLHKSDSPVPSILLIIMTAVLFHEYEKERKNFLKTP